MTTRPCGQWKKKNPLKRSGLFPGRHGAPVFFFVSLLTRTQFVINWLQTTLVWRLFHSMNCLNNAMMYYDEHCSIKRFLSFQQCAGWNNQLMSVIIHKFFFFFQRRKTNKNDSDNDITTLTLKEPPQSQSQSWWAFWMASWLRQAWLGCFVATRSGTCRCGSFWLHLANFRLAFKPIGQLGYLVLAFSPKLAIAPVRLLQLVSARFIQWVQPILFLFIV